MVSWGYAMVQSINTKALFTLVSVARRPYLMSPQIHVPTISHVDYKSMQSCGIKAVIFDKDNTITAPYETIVHQNAAVGLKNALDTFGVENVAILSNSAGTKDDDNYEDAVKIESELGIKVIRHDEKKPGGLKEVLAHFERQGVTDASQICMVGDRLLTDIVFGNLYGMLTVHCLPLCTGKENKGDNIIASMVRTVENTGLYSNWFVGRAIRSNTLSHSLWPGHEKCPLILVNQTSS